MDVDSGVMRVHPSGSAIGGSAAGWPASGCSLPTLSEGATDVDGPSLAPILIPVIGTLLLIACLALVFLAGHHTDRPTARGTNPQ